MRKEPLVSILIPVYKRAKLAIEAINCALDQDYENIEIVIGDNYSPDGTYELLKDKYCENSKIILFQNEANLGAVGNWEQCLKKAHGDYLKFLWSDDLMSKDYISKTVSLLQENLDASFAYSSVVIFQKTNQLKDSSYKKVIQYRMAKETGVYDGRKFIEFAYTDSYKVPVSPGCAIFRKEALHLITDIPNKPLYVHKKNGAGPDLLMFLEALCHGEKFIYVDHPDSYFREHAASISTFDNTIMDGYWTAKLFFLNQNKQYDLWKCLNVEIISTLNRKKFLNRAKNKDVLKKYYEELDLHINAHSIFDIFMWKVRKNIYIIRLKRGE